MDATQGNESVEAVRKIYVKDLREKQPIHTVFKVTRKARQVGRSGKPFVVVSFGDRTGEVDGRIFDNVDALEPTFIEGDYVLVKGNVITWQKHLQVVIEHVDRLDPEPIDPREFQVPVKPERPEKPQPAPRPSAAGEEKAEAVAGEGRALPQIRELVDRVQDPHVRQLLIGFLEDPDIAPNLAIAPAAKGIHHAYKGGLADHILSVMKLAHRIADHYPMADRDLLIAGALLHDICKVQEIVPDRGGGFEYSDEGRLVGHLVMTAQKIREKAARIPGFPKALEHHVTHVVLAHHGQLEWGSPKVPMTLEALLVHLIDTVDSRVASWLEIMERDHNEGSWTETSRLYDRHLWKGVVPTSRNRSPLDGRPGRKRGKGRGKGAGAGGGEAGKRVGAERGGAGEGKRAGGPGVPSFRPLTELAQAAGAATLAPAAGPEAAGEAATSGEAGPPVESTQAAVGPAESAEAPSSAAEESSAGGEGGRPATEQA